MQKKANILFFTLTLMIIVLTVVLIMSALFHIQTETLVIAKEGNNAFSAAQAGVEHARNSIRTRLPLPATTCNGITINTETTIIASFITYGPTADTTYSVSYEFICNTGPTPDYIRSLYSYNITSTGTFRGAVRTIVATRP